MTLAQVIQMADVLKENAFSDEVKTAWINEVEGMVQTQVMMVLPTDIITYVWPADQNKELLVPPPHSKLYWTYLSALIDFGNGEYDLYSNTMQLFNAHWAEFTRWFIRMYHPADQHEAHYRNETAETIGVYWRGYFLTAYGLAVKHGFRGDEKAWLESLIGVDGRDVQMQYDAMRKWIQWRLIGDDEWQDLLDIGTLTGDARKAAEDASLAASEAQGSAQTARSEAQTAVHASTAAQQNAQRAETAKESIVSSEANAAESAETAKRAETGAEKASETAQTAQQDADKAAALARQYSGTAQQASTAAGQSATDAAQSATAAGASAAEAKRTADAVPQTVASELERAKASGRFDGPKGDKGDPGDGFSTMDDGQGNVTIISATEVVYPPMLMGVEYKTPEYWLGKPVYSKLIEYTGYISVGDNMMAHNISNVDYMLRCSASTTDRNSIPMQDSVLQLSLYADRTHVILYAHSGISNIPIHFKAIQLWYTKREETE